VAHPDEEQLGLVLGRVVARVEDNLQASAQLGKPTHLQALECLEDSLVP
jgi:hypothetical protein